MLKQSQQALFQFKESTKITVQDVSGVNSIGGVLRLAELRNGDCKAMLLADRGRAAATWDRVNPVSPLAQQEKAFFGAMVSAAEAALRHVEVRGEYLAALQRDPRSVLFAPFAMTAQEFPTMAMQIEDLTSKCTLTAGGNLFDLIDHCAEREIALRELALAQIQKPTKTRISGHVKEKVQDYLRGRWLLLERYAFDVSAMGPGESLYEEFDRLKDLENQTRPRELLHNPREALKFSPSAVARSASAGINYL